MLFDNWYNLFFCWYQIIGTNATAVNIAGDVNGDGYADMVISGNGTYPLVIFGSSTMRDINVTSSNFASSNIGYKVYNIYIICCCIVLF